MENEEFVITNEMLQSSTPIGFEMVIPPSISRWTAFKVESGKSGFAGCCRIGSRPVSVFVYTVKVPQAGQKFFGVQAPDKKNKDRVILRLYPIVK